MEIFQAELGVIKQKISGNEKQSRVENTIKELEAEVDGLNKDFEDLEMGVANR